MTRVYFKQIALLIKRLLICYLLYFFSRLVFFAANTSIFKDTGFLDFLSDSFYGLRFDSFSIVISNSLFILLSLLPFNFSFKPGYQKMLLWLFVICNSIFLAFNFIDVAYFPFIKKRSSAELFDQLGGQSDMLRLIPQFALDFWWALLLFILTVYLLSYLFRRVKLSPSLAYPPSKAGDKLLSLLVFLVITTITVIGARGGLQRVPIDLVNAGSVTQPEEIPIVLNTPFTLIKSFDHAALEEYHFYDEATLATLYSPLHHFKDSTFTKQNVVVLILESFSKEYTKLGRIKSITPFLDSLMAKSLVFSNGFSNGTKSIEGIPAILSSMPSLMENPFINSNYANNIQTSLAGILSKEGYTTAFFHGGINGTMNFDSWAASAGYDLYFGKNEYNNTADFDGFWGIFDEPFLQYTATKLSGFEEPFHSAIFTLSSHHPYLLPEKYRNYFPKTKLENSESIGYADYSLRKFFETAKKMAWYKNTLFILTADHASISDHPFFSNPVGGLTIPILIFKPDNSMAGENEKAFSQLDILPTALNLIGYNKPFFSFGENYTSGKQSNAYFYTNASHFLYQDSMAYSFIEANINCIYNYKRDSLLKNNLVNNPVSKAKEYDARFKAFIQTYNHTLIHNSGYVK